MKKIGILLFCIITLTACSTSEDSSSEIVNKYSDFEQITLRIRITKNPDTDYTNINDNGVEIFPEIKQNVAITINNTWDIDNNDTGVIAHSIIDDYSNLTPSIQVLNDFDEDYIHAIVQVNMIPLVNLNNEHDFSYFDSLNHILTADVDVTGLNYFKVTAYGEHYYRFDGDNNWGSSSSFLWVNYWHDEETLIDGYNNNLIEYLEDTFDGYEINGKSLIIYYDLEI
ncbi:hypothetical protein GQ41_1177 [Arenibacter algicola]|uniref:Lipoprotein n=1 Tax=Arenibacter algicola TaxID=616991 RepID=A0ABY3A7R9_9FLAO